MNEQESIFKVTEYDYMCNSRKKVLYPHVKLREDKVTFFSSLREAEDFVEEECRSNVEIKNERNDLFIKVYAYIVTELPLGISVYTSIRGESLSERIYLPDGTLWGKNEYCNFIPTTCQGYEYNHWGRRIFFYGRRNEEIRFKPGDIVEVLGYPGNFYWSDCRADLAIVVGTPKTVDDISQMKEEYIAVHSGAELSDHTLGRMFGHALDTYEVVSLNCLEIDHSPTIATLAPKFEVPERTRNRLKENAIINANADLLAH